MGAHVATTIESASLSELLVGVAAVLVSDLRAIDSPSSVLIGCDRVSRAIASIQTRAVLEAENSGVVRHSGSRNTAAWIETVTGESRRGAHAKSRVVDAIKDLPALAEALQDGSVNSEQAELIHQTAANTKAEPEQIAKLIEDAKGESVKETERLSRQLEREISRETPEERYRQQRRKRSLGMRLRTDGSGMIEIFGQFDPLKGELIKTELLKAYKHLHEGESETREPRQIMADALEHLVTNTRNAKSNGPGLGSGSGSSGVDVVVTVTLEDLQQGLNATGKIAGSAEDIPVEQIRKIACEQGIIPTVLGSTGEVLDMGRRVRLATPAQKRALKATHGGCRITGCDVSFEFTQIHHIKEWLEGGLTDLANLIPLCTRHHHLVHDDGFTIVSNKDGSTNLEPPPPKPPPKPPP